MTFAADISNHWAALIAARGVAAVIVRGEDRCDVTRLLLARADAEAVTSRESRAEADRQDVIVAVSDYAPRYAGPTTATRPESGDQILVTVDGYDLTLEARPTGGSDRPARHTDETRQYWRISTKVVKREASNA